MMRLLRANGLAGWRRHVDVPGRPEVLILVLGHLLSVSREGLTQWSPRPGSPKTIGGDPPLLTTLMGRRPARQKCS